MISTAILGCAGYTGQETLDRLLAHPDLEPVALGSVGVAGEVPSVLDVEPGVVVTGELAGADGSTMLGGVPGPYSVLSWSGSRVWVSGGASGKDLTLEREWRWPFMGYFDKVTAELKEFGVISDARDIVQGIAQGIREAGMEIALADTSAAT